MSCTVTAGEERGLPAFLGRFRKRPAFLVGLSLSLVAVCLLSQVVFTVQVTGNQSVPAAQILGELRRLGLRPGVYGPGLELKQLSQEALLSLEDLSWLTVNLHGTRAEVIVREAVKPPELTQEEGCFDIVAKADGLIQQVEAYNGEALVKEGDVVMAGDVLITGHVSMKPPMYSDLPVRYFQTCARGNVWARTWRTITAEIPLTAAVKVYTGEEKTLRSLTIFDHRMDFYRNSSISWPFYDKITHVSQAALPSGAPLPVSWTTQTVRAYRPEVVEVDRTAAQALLEEQLQSRLEQLVGEEGKVEEVRFSARPADGWLQVTAQAQCWEQVGRQIPAQYPQDEVGP